MLLRQTISGGISGSRRSGPNGRARMRGICTLLTFLVMLPAVATFAGEPPAEGTLDYRLEVSFDIQASLIKGRATIAVKKDQEVMLHMGGLSLVRVGLDGKVIGVPGGKETLRILPVRDGSLEIQYEGLLAQPAQVLPRGEASRVIGEKGIFLTGTWYPRPSQMGHYHLTAILPEGYEAVSEAETIQKKRNDGKTVFVFEFPHPVEAISLIASDRYRIVPDHFRGVQIFAYFFPEDAGLVKTYIAHAKNYLQLYENLIGPFPYPRFSIVENFLPTGYSLPTYTVLGQQVIRLPFIPQTSLGHEILHQWFGNMVYIDDQKGNWAEGLTTFLADHLYEEEKGRGFAYRKGVLIDYQSYVNEKNGFALKDFRERTDDASQAIGYGKALMVFRMLKNLVGEDRFYEAIRYFAAQMRFRKASWEDIQRAVEKYYPKDLNWFFRQWIDEPGLPELALEDVQVSPRGEDFAVTFTVRQKKRVYRLDLPVTAYSYGSRAQSIFSLGREKERLEIILKDMPERMVLDEDYDLARMLSIDEFPPVIARLLGEEQPIIVLPPSKGEVYGEIVKALQEKGAKASEPELSGYKTPNRSLIILGADNPVVGRLYGAVPAEAGFSLLVREIPWNRWKVAGIFNARSENEVKEAFPKIFHYGKYSELAFHQGINIRKQTAESARGITRKLFREPVAAEVSTLQTLPSVMDRVADKKIVYVGETHNQFSHHVMELEVIKHLQGRGKTIAIGMEMFEASFQRVVNDYISGKIAEREFLKGTEYFQRWGFDYRLYRPILLYARLHRIPVIALNQRREIADQVFAGGLDSLSEEERKSVPSQMDFSNEAYRERLKKVFEEHKDYKTHHFDFFYQAQILWDETMSASIARFLRDHPDHQMVVLAGNGHLAYGSGIPERTMRRNGSDYAIILNDAGFEKGIADFVLFPGPLPGGVSPKLMVFLKEEAGKVEISGFPPSSVSERAGMKAGDRILAIGHLPIHTIDDVKIELLSLEKGEKVQVKVLREDLLAPGRQMDFEVVLQ
jgi:aminopeptidase N